MHGHQRRHVVVDERRIAANVSGHAEIMEWHKDAVATDESEHEMQFSEPLVHHSSRHLGKPEISTREHSEDRRYAHHHVEMPHNEIRGMKVDVERWLRQEKSANSAADEHGDKPQ